MGSRAHARLAFPFHFFAPLLRRSLFCANEKKKKKKKKAMMMAVFAFVFVCGLLGLSVAVSAVTVTNGAIGAVRGFPETAGDLNLGPNSFFGTSIEAVGDLVREEQLGLAPTPTPFLLILVCPPFFLFFHSLLFFFPFSPFLVAPPHPLPPDTLSPVLVQTPIMRPAISVHHAIIAQES
jgi:hypothetical protein